MGIAIDLSDKVAIVTGAGRGMGRAIALALAEAGGAVCVTARRESQLQETAKRIREKEGTALTAAADATSAESVARVVELTLQELGGLHLLINNAGMELAKPLLETSETAYARGMDTT